uniref:CFAP65 fourth Ig-like domain-containing protein n=1 Tax=Labrus bergylta TaxID=56723 RepID=A0A3Q3G6B8_9LABR
ITLKAVYKPTQPIAHHRRVACLILHREPMFLDLIGTCHSELQKPAVLKPEHLVLYKLHWYRRRDPTDTFSPMQQDQNVHLKQQGVLCPLEEVRTPMEDYFQSCMGCMDPFTSNSSSSSPHVTVVPNELLFDHKMSSPFSNSCTSSQSVSITNHTRGKLSLVWTSARDSPFSVSPLLCDLAPLKSTSFRVNFDPKKPNTLHEAQLECFAYCKVIFRNVNFFLKLVPSWPRKGRKCLFGLWMKDTKSQNAQHRRPLPLRSGLQTYLLVLPLLLITAAVLHKAVSSTDSEISSRRNWYLGNSRQKTDSMSVSIGKQ